MAITYTTSGSGVFTEDLVMDLYAGSPVDDTAWLDGGAAASTYPGGIDAFTAKNSPTTQATAGMKLVMGRLTTAVANAETMTISGDATTIQAMVVGGTAVAAGAISATFSGAVATFTVAGSPGTDVSIMMILA